MFRKINWKYMIELINWIRSFSQGHLIWLTEVLPCWSDYRWLLTLHLKGQRGSGSVIRKLKRAWFSSVGSMNLRIHTNVDRFTLDIGSAFIFSWQFSWNAFFCHHRCPPQIESTLLFFTVWWIWCLVSYAHWQVPSFGWEVPHLPSTVCSIRDNRKSWFMNRCCPFQRKDNKNI